MQINEQTGLRPVCYQNAKKFDNADCKPIVVAGYGHKGVSADEQADARLNWFKGQLYDTEKPRKPIDPHTVPIAIQPINEDAFPGTIHYASFEDLQPEEYGRSHCQADSGGPVMEYTELNPGKATLIGLVEGGVSCPEAFQLKRRRSVFRLPLWADNDLIWNITPLPVTPVNRYVDWINNVRLHSKPHTPPWDFFKWAGQDGGPLAEDPKWDMLNAQVKPTRRPPGDGPTIVPEL